MSFKRFILNISLQLILVILNCFFIVHSFYIQGLSYTRFHLIAILIIQFIALVYSFNANNRRILNILNSIKYNDLSFEIQDTKVSDLNTAIKETLETFRNLKFEKESLFTLLNSVLLNIPVALIVYNETEQVKLVNNSFLKLFNLKSLKTLHELKEKDESLSEKLKNISEYKSLRFSLKSNFLSNDTKTIKLSIKSSNIILQKEQLYIVSLQDIGDELAYAEIESWQKLIHVITHELMNSIAPIESLTKTLINLVEENNDPDTLNQINLQSVQEGLKAIEKRNLGLKKFISSYNKYSDIPEPNLTPILLTDLFKDIQSLIIDSCKENNIDFDYTLTSDELKINADEKMIFQVILNLIRNSIYFVKSSNKPQIQLSAFKSNNSICIVVKDNGLGISKELEDSIFIPFFSTKPDGTGIGLSISKKIMQMHKGDLSFSSIPNQKTEFTLKFI